MENKNNETYYKYNMQSIPLILVGIAVFAMPFYDSIVSVILKILSILLIIVGVLIIRKKVYNVICPNCGKSFAFSYNSEADTCIHCQKRILKTEKGFVCADDVKTDNSKT